MPITPTRLWQAVFQRLCEGTDTLKITHETIGNPLGNPREVVTRMLKYFVNEGLISLSRGTIEITNKNGLKNIMD